MRFVLPASEIGDSRYDRALGVTVKAADKRFRLLFAPDANGNSQMLARRIGVPELIGYWSAGVTSFAPCYTKRGKCLRGST